MGDAATPALPDFTSQTASVYKANIDAGFAVADRLAWTFAPHEQATPDMTVRLEAGAIFDGTTLTEVAAQSTGTFTAPTTNPRIDRVVIDRSTGIISTITGTEDVSPTAPAIAAGTVPIARVALSVGQTEIVNADITDERDLRSLGLGALALKGGVNTGDIIDNAVTLGKVAHQSQGQIPYYAASGAPAALPVGTSGQFLKTQGAGANPVWGDAGGGLQSVQVFTASSTWTKPAGIKKIIVEVVAGGGGGGGSTSTSARVGGGGGGGGAARELIDVTGTSSETVTVGSGGSAGSSSGNGGNGGASSFGAFLSATPGIGGLNGNAISQTVAGGTGSGGDVNQDGGDGSVCRILGAGADGEGGGTGGYGSSGGPTTINSVGKTGRRYGGGGNGGRNDSTTARAGGAGAAAIVIVWEYK